MAAGVVEADSRKRNPRLNVQCGSCQKKIDDCKDTPGSFKCDRCGLWKHASCEKIKLRELRDMKQAHQLGDEILCSGCRPNQSQLDEIKELEKDTNRRIEQIRSGNKGFSAHSGESKGLGRAPLRPNSGATTPSTRMSIEKLLDE